MPRLSLRLFAISGFVLAVAVGATAAVASEIPILVPFVLDAVRHPGDVPAHLLVYNGSTSRESLQLESLVVSSEGAELARVELDLTLAPDTEYGALAALVERLPTEFTERHRRRAFAGELDRELVESEIPAAMREIAERLSRVRERIGDRGDLPYAEIPVTVPLERALRDLRPGEGRSLRFTLSWRDAAGERSTASTSTPIRRLPPWRGAPESLRRELGTGAEGGGGLAVHAGDLHVHSCHGEALNACSPSANCAAESLQLSGSFSFAELKTLYQALGVDWFTATDHSYCINSESEYDAIAAEVAAITDAGFIAFPDTEVSSDEVGPQIGGDLGDILCLGLTSASHMGAHGIDSRIAGGDDGLLGFCDGIFTDALDDFLANIAEVRAEGGYPIAHHPAADSWGWNSFEETRGIEANGLHGVEIWNGGSRSGQGGDVASWVDWLLAGRILYAYSGSDTHDAPFDFGANRVIVPNGVFDPTSIRANLEAGRVYLSNEPFLAVTARVGSRTLLMGDRQPLPPIVPPGTTIDLRAHYDVGPASTSITIFRGRVGDASESTLCTSTVTGSGVLTCPDEVEPDATSYYRAYSEAVASDRVAYTNPIFLLR